MMISLLSLLLTIRATCDGDVVCTASKQVDNAGQYYQDSYDDEYCSPARRPPRGRIVCPADVEVLHGHANLDSSLAFGF